MYIRTYVRTHACTYAHTYVRMHVCMYACMHVCMYLYMYVCLFLIVNVKVFNSTWNVNLIYFPREMWKGVFFLCESWSGTPPAPPPLNVERLRHDLRTCTWQKKSSAWNSPILLQIYTDVDRHPYRQSKREMCTLVTIRPSSSPVWMATGWRGYSSRMARSYLPKRPRMGSAKKSVPRRSIVAQGEMTSLINTSSVKVMFIKLF